MPGGEKDRITSKGERVPVLSFSDLSIHHRGGKSKGFLDGTES